MPVYPDREPKGGSQEGQSKPPTMSGITVDSTLDVLRVRERRIIISTMLSDRQIPLSEVTQTIAVETGIDEERAKINVTHSHMPILEGYEVAHLDDQVVTRGENYAEVSDYLQAIEQV